MKEETLATKGTSRLVRCDFSDGEPLYVVRSDTKAHSTLIAYDVKTAVQNLKVV